MRGRVAPGRPLLRPAHGAGGDSRRRRRSRRARAKTAQGSDGREVQAPAAVRRRLESEGYPAQRADLCIQTSAIKSRKARKELVDKKKIDASIKQQLLGEAASKIQGLARGVKTRNKLNTDADFQSKIDMKIKKYGDAASEYSTRGKDPPKVNKEFSDIMKTMRTGLQTYKKTLGVKTKKRGPKPQQQNEFEF